jgi:hypothetical protein
MTEFGFYLGWGNARLSETEKWLGRKVDFIQLHGGSGSWTDLQTSLAGNISASKGLGRKLHLSQPMWAGSGNLEAAARGDYDGYWRTLAKNCADALGTVNYDVVMRFAVEANAPWMPWYFGNATRGAAYAAAFRRMSGIFKAAIPRLKIDFNFNRDAKDPKLGFPGRQYVDLISIDGYFEQQYRQGRSGPQFHEHFRTEAVGLDFTDRWAAELGVPWALAEYGCKSVPDADGAAWLDALTPYLVSKASRLAYVSYFNEKFGGGDPMANVELADNRPLIRQAIIRMVAALQGATAAPAPQPEVSAPIVTTPIQEPAPVATTSPAATALVGVNGALYTGKATLTGTPKTLATRWEGLAWNALAAAGLKTGTPPTGAETDPAKVAALIHAEMTAKKGEFSGAGLELLIGQIAALAPYAGTTGTAPTDPAVPDTSAQEIAALKAAVAKAQTETKAAQDALAALKKKLAELVA